MKISKANKGRLPPNTGKKLSAETRKKISDFHKGKPLSEEHKQNMRESHKNRPPISEETRKKLMGNTNAKKKIL